MSSKERFSLRGAVYLIPIKNDKVLLSRRYNTGWMDGKYSLIAGHLDGNETVFEAIVREALEEARIKVKKEDLEPLTVLHRKSDYEYVDFFFVTHKWEGEPQIGEPNKCDDLRWYELGNMPENILPYIRKIIDSMDKSVPFSESGW